MPGSLFLVATPIGNLEDITLRALRVLKDVDLIAAEDTRRTAHLLGHYGIATRTTSLHEHNERDRVPGLIQQVRDGLRLAVVTDAGMPGISDPGFLIAREALEAGVEVSVIPGASALTMAIAGSGLPADMFSFLGFAPSRTAQRRTWLKERLSIVPGTVVVYEAPRRLQGLMTDILEVVGDRYVVIAHELTKVHESWHRGWVSELIQPSSDLPSKGEFVVLISHEERKPVRSAPSEELVAGRFRDLSADHSLSRRQIIEQVASEWEISKRDVYSMIERAKNSGK
jgi:16S rRNA (cytidine1402-2'-O)-methyltransferase